MVLVLVAMMSMTFMTGGPFLLQSPLEGSGDSQAVEAV